LTAFYGLTGSPEHLSQLVIAGDMGTVFVDNIYLHR
jgi:hypothetical protein